MLSFLPDTVRVGRCNAELSWLRFLAIVCPFCCEVCVCVFFIRIIRNNTNLTSLYMFRYNEGDE